MCSKNSSQVVAALLLMALMADADTLVTRNGSRFEGSYLGGDNRTVRFAIYDRVNTYNLGDIESIHFSSGAGNGASQGYSSGSQVPPPYGSQNNPSAPAYGSGPNTYGSNRPPNANAEPSYNSPRSDQSGGGNSYGTLLVPAGTMLTVRLIDPVDSSTDRLGQSYRASLDQPVLVNGQAVIPRGSDVVATLIDDQKSGRISGRTSLTLDLKSVTVNGKQYDITTTGVSEESSSRGERSAKVIGGTAALGAIIGAIAGGGKGAAIGAGSGAAVGTAAQVVTSGQRVKVPAETRLSFTLQNPINL